MAESRLVKRALDPQLASFRALLATARLGTATAVSGKANLDSPILVGTPEAPTPAPGTSNDELATTAFVAAAITGLQPSDADLTAIAALVTTAFGRDFLTLADAAASRAKLALGSAAVLDADADGTLAANSDARVATQKAARTYIAAQIAALVNAAPGALDTLKELADALGDDANFAATMTAALAGKQPLDADLTAIAALVTTAFGRALLTLGNAAALTAALGFTALVKTAAYSETAISGEVIAWCNLAGGFTVTLPAAAGNGAKLTFKNLRGDGPVTIAAAGSDTIDGNAALLLSAQYAAVTLVSDGVSAWGII